MFFKKEVPRFGGETAEVLLQWLAPKHVTVSACIELRDKDDPQEVEYLNTNHQAILLRQKINHQSPNANKKKKRPVEGLQK